MPTAFTEMFPPNTTVLSSVLGPLSDAVAAIPLCPDSGTSLRETCYMEPQGGAVDAPQQKKKELLRVIVSSVVGGFRNTGNSGSWFLFVFYLSQSFS